MLNMVQTDVSAIVIFWGGIVSVLSPCVFPLLPVYFSMLAGSQVGTDAMDKKAKKNLMLNSVAFLLGISFVFILIGIAATALGRMLYGYMDLIRKAGGIFVIFLGLNYMGIINLKWINSGKRFDIKSHSATFPKSFFLGLVFSFGWTPCISSILTPVIFMASADGQFASAIFLLIVYSIGFSIPFLLLAFVTTLGIKKIQGFNKHMGKIKIIAGVLLIIMGIMLYTDYINVLTYRYLI
ncbi:cytochrome c-type biogenesis protein [Natranaerovirga hydrolytica]|uniref:Cytochrome c-type biogenesis protein n=1 Tax=Natranaerovirga hydrolytica TaxID=680378 RepID=A0A4R1MKV5_9FIRM|nr:cytochrome c biogenesis protein CcdA [Natranaerovirga hydrolytica]TCK92462.1 cytochrome c-type biogenesis protein [Natranaerovirga hydrolytica]